MRDVMLTSELKHMGKLILILIGLFLTVSFNADVVYGLNFEQEFTVIKVEISNISNNGYKRVPIVRNPAPNDPNDQNVTVTLIPSPLPPGQSVVLKISTISGAGSATFDDGTSTQAITQTKTLKVRGKTNSNVKDNIKLAAKIGGKTLGSITFSVRTWPVSYSEEGWRDLGNGEIQFLYRIVSESTKLIDLDGIIRGEIVTYTGSENESQKDILGRNIFVPSSPPCGCYFYNPHVVDKPIDGSAPDTFPDTHHDLCNPYIKPYREYVFYATQYYRFRDPLLMDQLTYKDIAGPIYIRRNVYQDQGVWKYRVEKNGVSAELILP
jgi:hypothetical protein